MKPCTTIEIFGKTYPMKNSIRAWQEIGLLAEVTEASIMADIYARNIKILHGLLVSGAEYERVFFGKESKEVPTLEMLMLGLQEEDNAYIVLKIDEAIKAGKVREVTAKTGGNAKNKKAAPVTASHG